MPLPRKVVWSLVVCASLVACEQPEAGPSGEELAADRQAVDAVREREAAMITAGNVDSLMSVYAADIDMMPPNEPAKIGAAAVRAWVGGMLSQVSVEAEYLTSEVELAGDWAIDRYTARVTATPRAGGEPMTEVVKGLHIYRRQADGTWKIAQDTWNTDAPPPPAQGTRRPEASSPNPSSAGRIGKGQRTHPLPLDLQPAAISRPARRLTARDQSLSAA